jgi:Na+/H+ antiporter NhaA
LEFAVCAVLADQSFNRRAIALRLARHDHHRLARQPLVKNCREVFGGIGFTMSIFITNLAFTGNAPVINASKMAILFASLTAGTIGFLWLKLFGQPEAFDDDVDAMDFDMTEV